ncbi:acyl carrier protein [Rhizobium sp. BK529]|uniref:acyl carrier protein n=1 Tax=unclassified Rhizobium TaxID=2613769 RepID=UPI0010449C80|nr:MULTISPECIES: acyl carrier protein [unclassified Rhizobium]MBB3592898.1 acyl carrier protein [Rhizobium sp. BK529]TCS07279.1 phosphopantetheine binding protein [Rhizobium sp. BK418]
MSNREKYQAAFTETFMLEPGNLGNLRYQETAAWDSVGHMALMAALEETFGIEMDIDDIIEFSSYETGQVILAKYDVIIEQAA